MAAINVLLRQIEDKNLRERLGKEIAELSRQKKYGLVFEDNILECTPLYGIEIRKGTLVAVKSEDICDVYVMISISDGIAQCMSKVTREKSKKPLDTLVVAAQFSESIFPSLIPIGKVENASDSRLCHTLIEADNYHVLLLLEYTDSYRHRKWLSMM